MRRAPIALAGAFALLTPAALQAQRDSSGTSGTAASAARCTRAAPSSASGNSTVPALHCTPPRYWRNFAAGFAASILAHEGGHVAAALAEGGHPYFGWDRARPTVYSGLNASLQRHQQYVFSSAGLDVQAILDEAILDVPHHRGAPFERGILAGGIATAYFYATLGRSADNSDITYIARTSSLTKTQASLIYAGIATIHVIRIRRNASYDQFFGDLFVSPSPTGALNVGMSLHPRG